MSGIIKEAVLKGLREWIESEGDHTLRIGRIKIARHLLDGLEVEANRTIKPIDLPLWYVEKSLSYYGIYSHTGIESGSWLLVREDADPDLLKWVAQCCGSSHWFGDGDRYETAKPHPLYPGFSNYVTIGNKVTPAKRYFQSRCTSVGADWMREQMIKHFGPKTWAKGELPKGIDGKVIYG